MIWLRQSPITGWIINLWMPNLFPKTHEGVKIAKLMFQKAQRAPRVSRMPEVHCFERPYQYLWHYERSGCILWVLKTPSAQHHRHQRYTQNSSASIIPRTPQIVSWTAIKNIQVQKTTTTNGSQYFSGPSLQNHCLKNPVFQNTLFEFLTYWHHVQMITLAFTFICALPSAPRSTRPFQSNPWKK